MRATHFLFLCVFPWSAAPGHGAEFRPQPIAPSVQTPQVPRDAIPRRKSPAADMASEKPRLRLNSSPQTIHGGVTIPAFVAIAEHHKFSFVPPAGWVTQSDASEKTIKLMRPDDEFVMAIRVVEEGPNLRASLNSRTLREQLLQRYPEGRVADESLISALGRTAPAFDIEWRTGSGTPRTTRCAIVPFPGGYLECSLTAATSKLAKASHDFNQTLLSIRSAPLSERLEFRPVSPE